jgi:hypothetical protein
MLTMDILLSLNTSSEMRLEWIGTALRTNLDRYRLVFKMSALDWHKSYRLKPDHTLICRP